MTKYLNKDFIPLILFLLVSVVLGIIFIDFQFDNDSYRLMLPTKYGHTTSLGYLFQIYTSTINHIQYRPSSFFLIFLITDLLNLNYPIIYFLVSTLFMALTGLYIFNILKGHFKLSNLIINTILLFFFTHIGLVIIQVPSFTFKYSLTLLILTYLCKIALMENRPRVLWSFGIIGFAITCHEAAIVFPFIYLGLRFFYHKLQRQDFCLIFPSILYLIARFFFWGMPKSNTTFDIIPSKIFETFTFYQNALWGNLFSWGSPLYFQQSISWYALLILAIFSILIWTKRNRWKELCLLLCLAIFSIIPFILIGNHVAFTRIVWALPFACFFLAILFEEYRKNKVVSSFIVILVFLNALQGLDKHLYYDEVMTSQAEQRKIKGSQLLRVSTELKEEIRLMSLVDFRQWENIVLYASRNLISNRSILLTTDTPSSYVEKTLILANQFFRIQNGVVLDPYDQEVHIAPQSFQMNSVKQVSRP